MCRQISQHKFKTCIYAQAVLAKGVQYETNNRTAG
jgi:hypothetical protein